MCSQLQKAKVSNVRRGHERRESEKNRDKSIVDMRVELRDKQNVEKRAYEREHELERKETKRLIYYLMITHVPIIKALSCLFTTLKTKLK